MREGSVVITGLGIVSSIGIGAEAYFDALLELRSGVQSLAARDDEGAKPPEGQPLEGIWIGAPITGFDAKPYVRPRKAIKVMCREIQTAYVASQLAIINAELESRLPGSSGNTEHVLPSERIGTVFGGEMMYGPPQEMIDPMRECLGAEGVFDGSKFGPAAMRGVMPLWMLKYLPNMPACHVGIAAGAHGPNNSLILGDISGPAALMEGVGAIRRGIADVIINGATGTRINTTRLNYRGDLPIAIPAHPVCRSSRPHDPSSAGVVGGEGAAALVLESASHASARGAKPLAVIAGSANRFIASDAIRDGYRSNATHPDRQRGSAAAIALAIEGALRQAQEHFGYKPADIGLVISHAMGDPGIDAAEEEALRGILPGVPATAPMSLIGHTGAASGSIGIVTAILSLNKRTIPPTWNAASASAGAELVSKAQPLNRPCAIALAHTAEGNATAVVLARP